MMGRSRQGGHHEHRNRQQLEQGAHVSSEFQMKLNDAQDV